MPGLQVVPQLPPALHDLQLPLPSQTWPVPQVMPGGALVCEQASVPELQVYVPGAQVEPQLTPSWLPQDPAAEPAVPPVPAPPAPLPPAPLVPAEPPAAGARRATGAVGARQATRKLPGPPSHPCR